MMEFILFCSITSNTLGDKKWKVILTPTVYWVVSMVRMQEDSELNNHPYCGQMLATVLIEFMN